MAVHKYLDLKEPTTTALPAQSNLDKKLPESVFQVRRNQTSAIMSTVFKQAALLFLPFSQRRHQLFSLGPVCGATEAMGGEEGSPGPAGSQPPTYSFREREIQTKTHSHRQSFQEKPSSRDAGSGVNKEKMQNSKRQGPKNISPTECAMERKGTGDGREGTPRHPQPTRVLTSSHHQFSWTESDTFKILNPT